MGRSLNEQYLLKATEGIHRKNSKTNLVKDVAKFDYLNCALYDRKVSLDMYVSRYLVGYLK